MAYFAVSYQLNNQKDYQTLWDEMDRLNGHKVMRSFYFIDTSMDTALKLKDHLINFVDEDDMIAVVEMTKRPGCYKCYQGTKAWLDARF